MITIKNLTDTPLTSIHSASEDAFSEYEVKMTMSPERLAEMLTTRSFDPGRSLGYFSGDQLVGFILVGYREIDGARVCYDIGTGVIQAFQQRGVGDAMLQTLMQQLHAQRIDRFVLEVLVNNRAAQRLYEKHGFKISRRLNCYEKPLAGIAKAAIAPPPLSAGADELGALDERAYNSFAPSWQNSLASYALVKDKYRVETISSQGRILAYGIVHQDRGGVLQLGISPQDRNQEIATAIVARLAQATNSDKLVLLNIEAGSEMETIVRQLGFSATVDQYEMIFTRTEC